MKSAENRKCVSCSSGEYDFENDSVLYRSIFKLEMDELLSNLERLKEVGGASIYIRNLDWEDSNLVSNYCRAP